jgi:hypothetical protein
MRRPPVEFIEDGGRRYVEEEQMGTLFVPSTGTIVVALLINIVHFVVWFAAFWAILQFTRGHAFALTTIFGLVTMLLVLPLLFQPNRRPKPPEEAPKAGVVSHRPAAQYALAGHPDRSPATRGA